MTNRVATREDALALTQLYQISAATERDDPVMLDVRWLENVLAMPTGAWFLAERGGRLDALVAFLVDREHQLCKISRMFVRAEAAEDVPLVQGLLEFAIGQLRDEMKVGDVIYTTTRSLTLAQQRLTLDLGFRVLGVFPTALGADRTRLNGLTASYAPGVLGARRHGSFALHPTVAPLYEIVRRQCELPELAIADTARIPVLPADPAPPLELIEAPNFVRHRFRQLAERKFLTVTFYPFAEPNALVTDAAQRLEIFLRVMPEMRFATILGERIEERVDPVALYRRTAEILHERGITYIEVINDAGDAAGIEAILRAGYLPCAYFPCLKNHGELRRDYVVFGRSFEAPSLPDADVDEVYLEYFRAYYRLHQHASIPPRARP
jgi:hypothetical protein